ncbi:MAG: polysaccharide export protein, partial [Desulfobacteraceae bacterium]|nr:polysaccharide export protein [Desulfobacteraceae bacterium]
MENGSAYLLGPEDVITISILAGGEEQTKNDMVVMPTGHLNVPFIGKIDAGGLTIEALEKLIVKPLERDFFVSP